MAIINIRHFERLSKDSQGTVVPVGELGGKSGGEALTFAAVTLIKGGTIPKWARFVRFLADADAYIDVAVTPDANVNSLKIESNVAEYFGLNERMVRAGTLSISVHDGAT